MANAITSCRILCSILMLFFSAGSAQFYILYLVCGLSDMVDGTVARKTNSISEFGARLDTVADFTFIAVSLMKFLPLMHIPGWLWIWIAVIAIVKIGNILWGVMHKKRLIALHTVMNKITGVLLFLLPLALHFFELKYSTVVVCAIATFSALQEGYYMGTGREIV
ncbi:MAG: CDP-alcohol phosphatidyltransferase family protein [Clostridia bacterium]|nr:CDP-alcohol phosphatidyltransferase family protein [Clostridia bacterium]